MGVELVDGKGISDAWQRVCYYYYTAWEIGGERNWDG